MENPVYVETSRLWPGLGENALKSLLVRLGFHWHTNANYRLPANHLSSMAFQYDNDTVSLVLYVPRDYYRPDDENISTICVSNMPKDWQQQITSIYRLRAFL